MDFVRRPAVLRVERAPLDQRGDHVAAQLADGLRRRGNPLGARTTLAALAHAPFLQVACLPVANMAAEIKLRAGRRMGGLLGEMAENGEREGRGGDRKSKSHGGILILEDLGVSLKEQHELALVSVPADADIVEGISQEEFPEDFEVKAVAGPWDPGTNTVARFTEELSAGRYALVCFVESADGTPHAFLGMVNEFTIE